LFKSKYIGDDGAVVGDLIYSKDAFIENVHFKKCWMSYYSIDKKAMLVNISDAIAMGAKPKYALLSVAMPKDMSKADMLELASGFKDIASKYNIEIIGGDTISNTKLDITITIVSTTKKPLYRDSAKISQYVAYTGVLGKSKKDLEKLLNGGKIHNRSKFTNIVLREKFIQKAKRYLSSGIDISDGLFSDLDKIAQASRVGYKFFKKFPKRVACSGEEYEMLITFDKRDLKTIKRVATQTRTQLSIIALTSRQRYKNRCKSHHFKR
jgi:thiamine-monophosphate kinase